MKKLLMYTLFILFYISGYSQNVDKVIQTPIYTSYFSYTTHTPLYVIYKLYHGGGKVSRSGMEFTTNNFVQSSTKEDYENSGYDIGHMCNAEDFAFDKNKEIITFRFYNALPQTPKLNRGTWKSLELKIRKLSQNDSILVICGGFNFNRTTKNGSTCKVPDYCYKIYKDLKTKQVYCYLFPNDNSDTFKTINEEDLLKQINYNTTTIKNSTK